MNDNPVIVCNDLTKNYGSGNGLFDLDLKINQGEIFGFIGPNGAGETGTIEFPTGQAFTSWNELSSLRIGEHEEEFAPTDPFALMVEDFGNTISGESAWVPEVSESFRVIEILDKVREFGN